jgi:uncharacterized protein (TIGR03435 family)
MKSKCLALLLSLFAAAAFGDDKLKPPTVGDQPPAIELQSLLQAPAGAKATWDSLRGKVVVLEFWATWCGPCVGEISHLNELTDAFKERPVQFIAITDEDEPTIKEFLEKKPIHGWVGLNTSHSMFKPYGIEGIPHTVVVGLDGRIAAITHPTHLDKKHLENVLAGKESGLPAPSDDDGPTVPARKADQELPAYFQFVIRPTKRESTNWSSGGAGTSELGPMYESKALGVSLINLLPNAYSVPRSRLIVEAPLPTENFDVIIRTTQEARKDFASLQRAAIEATFGLTSRCETRGLDVYILTVKTPEARGLKPTVAPKAGYMSSGIGRMQAINTTIDSWARSFLEGPLQKPIIDETGLKERYDIELRWDADGTRALEPEKRIEIAREQLGLELTPAKRLMEVVIVTRKGQ